MNEALKFLVLTLVCYRLARLIAVDHGPANIFENIRIRLGTYNYNENGEVETSIGYLFGCPHCIGIYMALPLAFLMSGFEWYTLVYWLAIAGGSSFLWSLTDGP